MSFNCTGYSPAVPTMFSRFRHASFHFNVLLLHTLLHPGHVVLCILQLRRQRTFHVCNCIAVGVAHTGSSITTSRVNCTCLSGLQNFVLRGGAYFRELLQDRKEMVDLSLWDNHSTFHAWSVLTVVPRAFFGLMDRVHFAHVENSADFHSLILLQ